MRPGKIFLLATVVLITTPTIAQLKLGLKVSPNLSVNRVETTSDSVSVDGGGTAVRFAIGPIADYEIRENYFISSGLLFVSKRVGLSGGTETAEFIPASYNLQYLQIPLTLKLFTNEVALDKKLFFQLGGTLDFLINQEKDDKLLVEDFLFFDATLLIGMGLEYKVGLNTIVFGGFSYNRGLINAVNEHAPIGGDLSVKNDYISLDLGIKF
ncbi:MAG: porin family protein [Fulvivirga sp.]|nr:porin family protein [Fulvivirga sp.]